MEHYGVTKLYYGKIQFGIGGVALVLGIDHVNQDVSSN
jgi:hypothetical protein